MVYKEVRKGKTVVRDREKKYTWLFLVLLTILVATLTVVLCLMFFGDEKHQAEIVEDDTTKESASLDSEIVEIKPEKIDFQPVLDEWVSSLNGNKSVLIYDLERNEIVGEYNTEEDYNTASLYKLFVVYEGYRRIESGEWQIEDPAGTTGYTVLECLDLAIRESYSPCAETLWAEIGHNELDEIIATDFGITNSDISSLLSNPGDIMKMMKIFYEHLDIKDEILISRMQDSFLNQPKTTYDWRQGLPSGFSDKVNVYNKVGWAYNADAGYWNIYHDAAILEFPEDDRHFIIVVMTNKVPYQQIRKLGTMIEEKFYQ